MGTLYVFSKFGIFSRKSEGSSYTQGNSVARHERYTLRIVGFRDTCAVYQAYGTRVALYRGKEDGPSHHVV